MKTNLLTSKLNKARTALCLGAQPNSPASPERRGGGTGAGWYTRLQAALNNKTAIRFAKYLIPITILLLFFLLLSLTSCKTPATLTNNTQHHTLDSNYHASIQRIETHDTIILGYYPSAQPKLSNSKLSNCPIVRISDRKITIRDTVFYRPHRHPLTHTDHHPKRTLHPTLLPLLHHNTCHTYHNCHISI